MQKYGMLKFLISLLMIILIMQFSLASFYNVFAESNTEIAQHDETLQKNEEINFYYLSDMEYITTNRWSYAGYGSIMKDKNINGEKISLIIDGSKIIFNKGIGAHASSQLTYDISEYSDEYTRFVAKLGIDSSQNGKGDVWFRISVSNDGTEWKELYKSEPITSNQSAYAVDIDISNYKYLRLYADQNGGNGNDHSVFGDARLVKRDYDLNSELYQGVHRLEYYDEILSKNNVDYNYENNLKLVLEREFVSRVGFWAIQDAISKGGEDIVNVINWLKNDSDALELFINSGEIKNGVTCLNALSQLYKNYKDVIGSDGDTYVYKKMLIALAIAYSSDIVASPLRFNTSVGSYDVVKRFELVKKLYDDNLFLRKEEFKTYNMELIRFVMNDSIANEEVLWLRGYSEDKYPDNINAMLNPYSYMNYVLPLPSYNKPEYFDMANKKKYDEKYELSKYNVSFGEDKTVKTWMSMETGGICWNISRLGQNLYKVHGIPAVGTYQPGHEAYFYYTQDNNGNGMWNIGNNISGWGKSFTSWYGGNIYRLLLGWGNKSYNSMRTNNSSYLLLAQGALNDYENYKKSFYYNLISNSYSDYKIKEKILEKSLECLNINLDTYEDLINLYKTENKTTEEWKELANKIIQTYTYYPIAMVDLLNLIYPYLSQEDTITIDILKTEALNNALNATNKESLQPNACKEVAQSLLGENLVELASFSFDGEDARKIVINSKYDDYEFQVRYSLDGGSTWKTTLEHKIELTKEEIASINAENDIRVQISGSNEVYIIDILNGENISNELLDGNDDENRFIGKIENLEYSLDGGITWTDYSSDIEFTGDKVVQVRYKAHGIYLEGEAMEFKFTDIPDITTTYIPVKYINFVSAAESQDDQPATNMIDASPFTTWHTKFGKVAKDKAYVTVFDKERVLSQIAYDPSGGANGRIKDVEVYVSLDGKNWTLSGKATNWSNNKERKILKLSEPKKAKYVKILATATYSNGMEEENKYVSGVRFNYYEDVTKTIKLGNINNDEVIDILDLSILNKYLLGLTNIEGIVSKMAADLNEDGEIDILDLSMLNKIIIDAK